MPLIGPTSSSVDFSPQGLLEKVFTPLVRHSQICPGTCGWAAVCTGGGEGLSAESGCAVGGEACGGVCGAACAVTCAGACAVVGAGRTCGAGSRAAATGGKVASGRCVETAAKATAMAAADRPPKIQGSKSRSFFMIRLSSAAREVGVKIRIVLYRCNRRSDLAALGFGGTLT